MSLNDADGMANSVDADQTALFAQAYLSEITVISVYYISSLNYPLRMQIEPYFIF